MEGYRSHGCIMKAQCSEAVRLLLLAVPDLDQTRIHGVSLAQNLFRRPSGLVRKDPHGGQPAQRCLAPPMGQSPKQAATPNSPQGRVRGESTSSDKLTALQK